MSQRDATAYLAETLKLSPSDDAAEMLRRRAAYLAPNDPVVAVVAEESRHAFRLRLLNRLHEVRRNFWRLAEAELQDELSQLHRLGCADISVAASRLLLVARERPLIVEMREDARINATFMSALTQLLIAPSLDANQIREREHRWIRPERNPQYESARKQILSSITVMRAEYPTVYALEEDWLNEMLVYNPEDEKENETALVLFALGVLGFAALTLFGLIRFIWWLFQ